MKNKKVFILIILLVLAMLYAFAGCNYTGYEIPDEDKILVNIQLDLDEDIGLLLTEWDINGQTGGSGACNADRSMLKRDSLNEWEFDRVMLEKSADTYEVKLKFIVVTEYFDPNYDFDYPDEYKIPMNEIAFTAKFGEAYYVTITGGHQEGYQAVLQNQ
jgi:hypothetical protein